MRILGPGGFLSPINMLSNEWRKPFNISIGLHILVVIIAMLAPTLFDHQPKLPEIYTVNLFSASEVAMTPPPAAKPTAKPTAKPAAKPAAKPVVRQIEPEVKKPAVSIQPSKPEVTAPVKTVISKPVSLKPIKMKIKVGKTKEEEAIDKAKLSKVVQQMKAQAAQKEAQAAQKEAQAEAEHAAKDAVSKLAEALKTTPGPISDSSDKAATGTASTTAKTAGIIGPRGTGIEPDFYMKQYYATISDIIQDHYILSPHLEMQNWDKNLQVIIGITIQRDGTITKINFEERSTNMAFNRSSKKAIEEASPLPPFPNQLKEDILEIGFIFHPGGLY